MFNIPPNLRRHPVRRNFNTGLSNIGFWERSAEEGLKRRVTSIAGSFHQPNPKRLTKSQWTARLRGELWRCVLINCDSLSMFCYLARLLRFYYENEWQASAGGGVVGASGGRRGMRLLYHRQVEGLAPTKPPASLANAKARRVDGDL
ncbi:unnamed protein product, partial [Iphiclides podalirius]